MTKLEKIERDIAALSYDELTHLREWFEHYEADVFDRRVERDAAAGRLDTPADAALSDHRASRLRLLRQCVGTMTSRAKGKQNGWTWTVTSI